MKSLDARKAVGIALVVYVLMVGAAALGFFRGVSSPGTTPDTQPTSKPPRMDVVFVVDATGSMTDEIDVIRQQLRSMARELANGQPRPDIRFGLVLYKDDTDEFVTKKVDLTRDVQRILTLLGDIQVSGGGDNPEAVDRGLQDALAAGWDDDPNTLRTIYLVGDAPNHGWSKWMESDVRMAKGKHITINTIGCSGIELDAGKQQFRDIAARTGGTYEPLTYHAVVQGQDGRRHSVITYDGHTYQADDVLSDEEWERGAKKLEAEGKLEPATGYMRHKAAAAPKRNNLDRQMMDGIKGSAAQQGVAW